MQHNKRPLWLALAVAAIISVMAVVACSPAAGVPAGVSQTVQSAATNVAPTVAAAGQTVQAAVTQVVPTVQAVATQAAGGATGNAADTLVIAKNINDVVTFDPAEAYEFSGILGVHNIYDTLVKFEGADLTTLKPALADSWDIKDAGDHWEITFKLKDGVKFASGNPFTSEDVVYSFQRIIALNKQPAFLFTDVGKLTADSIKAPDAKTVVLSLPKDTSPAAFLTVLTGPTGGIVDAKETKAHEVSGDMGNVWLKDHSAGSGPYMLDHWTKDVEFLLKANPNAAVQPKMAQILVKHVEDPSVQQSLLEKGDADIATDMNPEQIASLQGKDGVTSAKAGNLQIIYLGMNVAMPPLDKPEVREALRYAVDYEGITQDLLSGNAQIVQTIVPIGLFGANKEQIYKRDVAKAKELLAKGGVPDGFTIDLQTYTGNLGIIPLGDLAAKIQSDLAEIGVKVNISQRPAAELLADYRAQKAPIVLVQWGPDFPDPDANGTPFSSYDAKSIAWRNSWNDPKAAELAQTAALETDNTKRAADYAALTDYVAHNGPYGVLFQPLNLFGLRSNVTGFEWSPIGYADLWTVAK